VPTGAPVGANARKFCSSLGLKPGLPCCIREESIVPYLDRKRTQSQSSACDHSVCVCPRFVFFIKYLYLCQICGTIPTRLSPPHTHRIPQHVPQPTTDKVEMGESAPMTRAGCSRSWLGGGKRSLSTRSSSLPGKCDSRHCAQSSIVQWVTSLLPLRHRFRSPATERGPPTLSDIHQVFTGGRAVFHALLPFFKNIAQCSGPTVFHVVLPRGSIHFVFLVDEVGLRLGLAEALFSSRITQTSLSDAATRPHAASRPPYWGQRSSRC